MSNNMESASRKRKRCHVDEKEEENEEEKIERFFKLIKSIREAREWLLMKESTDHHVLIDDSSPEIDKMRNKKLPDEKLKAAVWKPCFQLEDFMEDHHKVHHFSTSLLPSVSTPPSGHQLQGSSKEKIIEGLDLNLSL